MTTSKVNHFQDWLGWFNKNIRKSVPVKKPVAQPITHNSDDEDDYVFIKEK